MGILPGLVVYFFYLYHILDTSVLCTAVEFFRVRRMVMSVVRHQKEDRAVMLLKMQTVVGDADGNNKLKSALDGEGEAATSLEIEHLADIFDNLDKDHSGTLSEREVGQLLKEFGIDTTTEHG